MDSNSRAEKKYKKSLIKGAEHIFTSHLFLLFNHLKHAHLAANLGAVETTVGTIHTTSHAECTLEERKAMGLPEGLVRYSTGIENASDLIADLEQALEKVKKKETV